MLLSDVPPESRRLFAQNYLAATHPDFVRALQQIPREIVRKSVLFIAERLHSREIGLAKTARLAGWEPILAYVNTPHVDPGQHFRFHFKFPDQAHQVLASWLFSGPLVHVFIGIAKHSLPHLLLKDKPTALDIYDTTSGLLPGGEFNTTYAPGFAEPEREMIRLADGITHRDLRVTYLHKYHGYEVPPLKILFHDPVTVMAQDRAASRNDGEIRVVSTGAINKGDCNILRILRSLCRHGIHTHVYLTPSARLGDPDLPDIGGLVREFPSHCHLEKQVFGNEYFDHLSRYDFGLSSVDRLAYDEPMLAFTEDYLAGCGSSRLSDYIAMGLGVLVAPRLKFQSFLARRYAKAVVSTTREFMENPRPVLEAAQEARLRTTRRLDRLTPAYSATRLGRFYEQMIAQGERTKV